MLKMFQVCCSSDAAPPTQPPAPPTVPVGGGLQASDLPEPGTCGSHLANRIVGGEETEITEFPWMVLIEYTKRKFSIFISNEQHSFRKLK